MPSVSLQDIRDAADEKYGPLVIEGVKGGDVELLNPARLSKEDRAKLKASLKAFDAEDENADEAEVFAEVIRIVAKSPAHAKRLLAEFDGDVAGLGMVFQNYLGSTKVGEASPSPS